MRSRFLNVILALGLVTAVFASLGAGVSATPEQPGQNAEYFPFVLNNTDVGGIKGFNSTLTIQNVEIYPVTVSFYGADGTALKTGVPVDPRAEVTFSAASLGVKAGGQGVYVTTTWENSFKNSGCIDPYVIHIRGLGTTDNIPTPYATVVTGLYANGVFFRQGIDFEVNIQNAGSANATVNVIWLTGAQSAPAQIGTPYILFYAKDYRCIGNPRIAGVEKHISADGKSVDGYNAIPVQDFLLAANDPAVYAAPEAALDNSNDWVLPIVQTNGNGDGMWDSVIYITNVSVESNSFSAYFYAAGGQGTMGPSVQLNCTNGVGSVLKPGDTCIIDLKAMGVPDGAVGSVWINSTHGTASMVAREKAAVNMSLTNVAQPRSDTNYNPSQGTYTGYGSCAGAYTWFYFFRPVTYGEQGGSACNSDEYVPDYSVAGRRIAPLVFRDYNGWNTGINIANLSSDWNNVTIEYFNYAGDSVSVDSVNLPPQGMEYVYIPATTNSGSAPYAISSAIITGASSLAAVVDEVKYLGGAGHGQAMSYAAQNGVEANDCYYTTSNTTTGGVETTPVENNCIPVELPDNSLADVAAQAAGGRVSFKSQLELPLFQKGMNGGSTGSTSGINMFNADQSSGITGMVTFLNTAGRPVSPSVGPNSQEAPFFIDFGPLSGKTLYAGNYNDLPDNFTGSVLIGASWFGEDGSINYSAETRGNLVAVSNNVDYGVDGDGAAVFNLAPVYSYYGYAYWSIFAIPPGS